MKYIHIYNTKSEYNDISEKEHYDMSLIRDEDNHVIFLRNYYKEYLTLKIITSGTFTILPARDKNGTMTDITEENALTISYSINDAEWISSKILDNGLTLNVSNGDEIRFKGTNTNYCNNNGENPHKQWHIVLGCNKNFGDNIYKQNSYTSTTATFIAYGNIMSLCYGDNFIGETTLPDTYTFCSLFKTSNIISAKNLILPATTLVESCYRAMFSKAKLLKESPMLLAKNLIPRCYFYMFEDCDSLIKITCLAETGITYDETDGSVFSFTVYNKTDSLPKIGTFIKSENATWITGRHGIPKGWVVKNYTE